MWIPFKGFLRPSPCRNAASTRTPRSTVGTLTEIHDHLRLLFTHVGRPHCQRCGSAITVHTVEQMVDDLLTLASGARVQVLAPLPCDDPGEYRQQIETVIRAGFVRIKVDGEILELADLFGPASPGQADLPGSASPARADLVVDRLAIRESVAKRLADSIEVALKHGDEVVKIDVDEGPAPESRRYTRRSACLECGAPFPQTVPQLFSFNSPHGACPACNGLGIRGRSRGDADASPRPCPKCAGTRLRGESLQVRLNGMDIGQVSALPLSDFSRFVEEIDLDGRGERSGRQHPPGDTGADRTPCSIWSWDTCPSAGPPTACREASASESGWPPTSAPACRA